MSWKFPDEPLSWLTFALDDTDDGCRLTLRHRNLGEWAPSYRIGWLTHLTFLEASFLGEPLPLGQFWNIHATLSEVDSFPQ